ncbi:MAG: ubiquinol-cytochrome c reductase iron-sulfur subunit [Neomegalonema sp.]|nr:ubiquinol-cytochrome c reductase iron-sulfur subunit [Neomegalonema sp.]
MAESTSGEGTRRDFLYIATGAAGVVAAGTFVAPQVAHMWASWDVQARSSVKVKYNEVEPGQQIVADWLGKPVFIRRRTAEEVKTARSVDLADLPDPVARNANLSDESAPATDEQRSFGKDGEWLIAIGVCTHLGCVPIMNKGDYHGWYCPCHGSHYDLSGRIRKGPAPENLPIPKLAFLEDGETIKIG